MDGAIVYSNRSRVTAMAKLAAVVIFLAVVSGVVASAQSRRVPSTPQTSEKPNQRDRPAEPTPSPTPDPDADESDEIISVDTKLVTIPVRVLDRRNRFIGGLKKENFSIFEDNIPQELAYFSNEAQPFTVALVLDMSYSTTFKLDEIQGAAIAFIEQLRPDDKVMVISFDGDVHMLCEATSDRKRIYLAIRSTRIATGTSLYEAVDLTMNLRMRPIQGRKAIVLFTDGVDTTSRRANDLDNLRDALELDALIYPIRYDTYADVQAMKRNPPVTLPPGIPIPDSGNKIPTGSPTNLPTNLPFPFPTPRPSRSPSPRTDPTRDTTTDAPGLPPSRPPVSSPGERGTTPDEYAYAAEYLGQLAARTGGRTYVATSLINLNDAFAKIASELREFYSIGYYPQGEPEPGKTRRIKVRVDRSDIVVKARDSYVVAKK